MSHHIFAVPLLTAHPAGWLAAGAAAYLAYAAGKKSGRSSTEDAPHISACDRAVKGLMKTAYKAKLKAGKALSAGKDKYAGMWREAQAEAAGGTADAAGENAAN